jgi:site-specific recombinase XerD
MAYTAPIAYAGRLRQQLAATGEGMATSPTSTPNDTSPFDLPPLLASWRRHLTAQRMSPATLATYSAAVRGLDAFLAAEEMPRVASSIRREHVEAFITNLLERWKPATAHNRYRALRAFFGWLVEEGEITESPMVRMKPPRLPEEPPPVLREGDFRRLLESCERDKTFAGRRDDAILRVLIDTGSRRGEVLGLRLEDVDLDQGLLRVTGKGSRTRFVPVGAQTVRSLDRYLRARAKHPTATSAQVWLSRRGVLRESGLADLVRDRGREAGLTIRLHPHAFRHAYAHAMLAAGMQETDLMAVVGWRSREMVTRYAAATRAERAIAAARKLSPVDRLAEPTR